jgi:uncharacterized protein YegP (UPF0339 family)
MRLEIFQDRALGWRWRLVAANGKTVADSGESYTRKRDALRAVRTFRGLAWRAPVIEIDAVDQSRIDARLASLRTTHDAA